LTESRIKYAYYLAGWVYGSSKSQLRQNAQKVIPSEYQKNMDGSLFCPECCTPLTRSPKEKDTFSNGRKACFVHYSKYSNVKCDLRTNKPEGNKFVDEEDVKEAIENELLVVVSGFMENEPQEPEITEDDYSQSQVDNIDGPETLVPLARHTNGSMSVPSKVTTIRGICRNFDENLYKYFHFPHQQHPLRLIDILIPVQHVLHANEFPKIYYGKIIHSYNAGQIPRPSNIRMTELLSHNSIHDFFFKQIEREAAKKGISDTSEGRYIIMYGKVEDSGMGLCIQHLNWGEFALLPEKYNSLLD